MAKTVATARARYMARSVCGNGGKGHCISEFRIRHDDNRAQLRRICFMSRGQYRIVEYIAAAKHGARLD